jgi:hypothetical protein
MTSRYPLGMVDHSILRIGVNSGQLRVASACNQSICETTYMLLSQSFQSGVVNDKGAMLNSARWRFIEVLNAS